MTATVKWKQDRNQGFTLIEVMIALVLLAVSMGAVLGTINQFSFQLVQSQERFHSHRIAMHVAGQYKVQNDWPSLGKKDETISVGDVDWKWQATTTQTPVENVRRVRIQVFPPGSDAASATVVVFQARPL